MILFLSDFTIIIEKMEFDMQAEIIVVVIIDKSALTVLYYEVKGLIFLYSVWKDCIGFGSIKADLMNSQRQPHGILTSIRFVLRPSWLRYGLNEKLVIATIRKPWCICFKTDLCFSWSEGHLIEVDPTFVASYEGEFELSLEYSWGGKSDEKG